MGVLGGIGAGAVSHGHTYAGREGRQSPWFAGAMHGQVRAHDSANRVSSSNSGRIDVSRSTCFQVHLEMYAKPLSIGSDARHSFRNDTIP